MKKYSIDPEAIIHPAVSLFLKWYLCRETLMKKRPIRVLIQQMEAYPLRDRTACVELLRRRLLFGGLGTLGSLLERPLKEHEVVCVCKHVEEFVQRYEAKVRNDERSVS